MDNLNRQVSLREYEPPSGMGPSEKGVITAELIHRFVTFRVHGQTYGLPLESVERAQHASWRGQLHQRKKHCAFGADPVRRE